MARKAPPNSELTPKPHLVGYARVSTKGQTNQRQLDELLRYGVAADQVFQDTASGKSLNRPGWRNLWRHLREGDVLVVLAADRLGRNLVEIVQMVEKLRGRGVGLKVIQNGDIDTTTLTGQLIFNILALMADWERKLALERTKHGLETARERGRVGGRAPKISDQQVDDAIARQKRGEYMKDIAKEYGVTAAALYKRRAQKLGLQGQPKEKAK